MEHLSRVASGVSRVCQDSHDRELSFIDVWMVLGVYQYMTRVGMGRFPPDVEGGVDDPQPDGGWSGSFDLPCG